VDTIDEVEYETDMSGFAPLPMLNVIVLALICLAIEKINYYSTGHCVSSFNSQMLNVIVLALICLAIEKNTLL
jgi:hypothetical protein